MNKVKRCRYGVMVYQPNDSFIGRSLDLYSEYSEGEVALFREVVKPGHLVLDVGANIGAHTVAFARLVGHGGRVLAFEPQRYLYYCLCGNVVLNSFTNVVCHQTALGDTNGMMRVPEVDYNAQSNFGGIDLTQDFTGVSTYSVPSARIDDMELADCHFIKIDVEGMERQVLQGAAATIRRHRPLLYLEDDRPERSAGLAALLDSLAYEVYLHRPLYFNPANLEKNQENVFPNIASFNLFCFPRESACPVDPAGFGMVEASR